MILFYLMNVFKVSIGYMGCLYRGDRCNGRFNRTASRRNPVINHTEKKVKQCSGPVKFGITLRKYYFG